MKPRVFIGSSKASLNYAYAIQKNLGPDVEATVWTQGVFELTSFPIESILKVLDTSDFGIFVFAPDDTTILREVAHKTVRDNVVFELGLFIGRLGRERNFIVAPSDQKDMHILSDLTGLTLGYFDSNREDGNLQAALGPASHDVNLAVRKLSCVVQSTSHLPAAKDADDFDALDEVDCLSLLKHWLSRQPTSGIAVEKFDEIDLFSGARTGSAKKYFEQVAQEQGFATSERGNQTIRVDYGSRAASAPRFVASGTSRRKRPI